jgi:uncharacterized protein YbbC (DUF1343 family)
MVILEPAVKTIVCAAVILLIARSALAQTPKVQTGIEFLRQRNFDVLRGKRVGLITNPTGVDSRLKSTIDILHEAKGLRLVALFGPEHGVRGDVPGSEKVDSYIDPQTNLPVYSLYGKTKKPTADMLKNIDVLVYDVQDVGCRSYSYISTMGLAMEAAAENKIPFVVLDRPDPLGGIKIEGNLVEKGFESFVGQYPIPYVYGLTCGELARLLNEEGLLANGLTCRLTVVPMKGWKRTMTFSQTGLPWVPTSPHVPSASSPQYYVSTGILGELGVISEGVGYTIPFQTCAAEWIDQKLLADKMIALKLEGVLFRPIVFKPFYGKFKDKKLKGVEIHITDYGKVHLMSLQFIFMEVCNGLYPGRNPFTLADSSRIRMFDSVVGTDKIRELFTKRMVYADIKSYLEKDVDEFRARAKKYYLYR